jgi:hypothetical protein
MKGRMKIAVKYAGWILLAISGMTLFARAQQDNKWPIESSGTVIRVDLPFSWPRNKHEADQIGKQTIEALFIAMEKEHEDDYEGKREEVESYAFTALDSGPLYLVATTDGWSTWIQYINVVRCEEHTCHLTVIHSDSVDLDKQLVDLNKDGRHQILAEECVCLGVAHAPGTLPYLFEVSDNEVRDSSARYPEYFRSWLSPIPLGVPDEFNSQEMIDEQQAELLFAQHDVERRVFGKKEAGLSDALQWEKSKSTTVKFLAIDTFEAVETPEADTALQRLLQSDSPFIRQRVQGALARKALKQPRNHPST